MKNNIRNLCVLMLLIMPIVPSAHAQTPAREQLKRLLAAINSGDRPTLEHVPPPLDPDARTWDYGDMVWAMALLVIGMVLFLGFNLTTPSNPATTARPLASFLVIGGTLGGIAYYKWTRQRSKAFAAGLLIGVGVFILLLGLCFAVKGRL